MRSVGLVNTEQGDHLKAEKMDRELRLRRAEILAQDIRARPQSAAPKARSWEVASSSNSRREQAEMINARNEKTKAELTTVSDELLAVRGAVMRGEPLSGTDANGADLSGAATSSSPVFNATGKRRRTRGGDEAEDEEEDDEAKRRRTISMLTPSATVARLLAEGRGGVLANWRWVAVLQ